MRAYYRRILTALLVFCLAPATLTFTGAALYADTGSAATSTSGTQGQAVEEALDGIARQQEVIGHLQARAAQADGTDKEILEVNLDKAWLRLLSLGLGLGETYVAGKDDASVAPLRSRVIKVLESQTAAATTTIQRIRSRIHVPDLEKPAAEQAVAFARASASLASLNDAYGLLVRNLDLLRQLGLDVSTQEQLLRERLSERAMTLSYLLEMAADEAGALRDSAAIVPSDAELKAKLAVASNAVNKVADGLSQLLTQMESLGMETADYRQQVLHATGEITSDVFDVSFTTTLLVGWGKTLWNYVIEDGPDLIFKVVLFLVLLVVFRKLARIVQNIVEGAMNRASLQLSELLRRMVLSAVRNTTLLLGILIALSQLGISLGPLLAGLGVAGFVIGFALQDSLSNFASGMMILIYRPYDVGDLIETAGVFGKVSNMSLVNTTIMTPDNQSIVMPNNKIWGDVIKNVTAQTLRRVDMTFGISYSDDIPKTEKVLREILDAHEKVLPDPEPIIRLHELADSSVNFVVRPWVNRDDYWDVYWDVTREVKMRFDREGISIPFPQRDIHLYSDETG